MNEDDEESPVNLDKIINLEGKDRLDMGMNHGIMRYICFISNQQGVSVPEYIYRLFKKDYDNFISKNGSLFYNETDDSFYMEKHP